MSNMLFLDLLKETMVMVLMLSAPILVTAMTVGLAISLFQAVTQIQEATLTFVPKILISMGVIIFVSPWMLTLYINHTQRLLHHLITIARQT